MKKLKASLASLMLAVTLTSCGYQGGYRYPCQDPANWEKAECNPPVCNATGTCSKDIVGEETWAEYEKNKVKNG
jgi:predicted small lipoprotein YifL